MYVSPHQKTKPQMDTTFKATTFFPKQNDVETTAMNQCIESGLPTFAKDTGRGALKSYFACGYEHFCLKLYKDGVDRYRNIYELLQLDKPTKIYLDFDHSTVSDKAKFGDSTNKFIKHVYSIITERTGKSHVPFYVLEASTDAKLSLHVIFECFLADIPTVKNFVQYALDECPCEYLDDKVYTRNRLFRLLYSRKHGKPMESSLRVNGTTIDAMYDPMAVFKTMIQAMVPAHYFGPFSAIKDELAGGVTFIKLTDKRSGGDYVNGYSGAICRSLPSGFNDFVETMGGGVVLSAKENDGFISCIVGGKACPWKGSPHKNNNQYFTVCKNNLRGFFQCADQDCADTAYDHTDVSFLWRKDRMSL